MPDMINSFKLADYSVTGSIAAQIAVFASKTAQQHRDAQKQGWDTALKYAELEHANMLKQADEMRSAAGARLAGAITQGALGVVGGAVQVGASAKAMGYARQAAELERKQAAAAQDSASPASDPLQAASAQRSARRREADDDQTGPAREPQRADGRHASEYNSINTLNNESMAINQMASAVGMVANSLAQAGKGAGDFIAAIDDAQKTELEAEKKLMSAAANVNNQKASIHGEQASKLLDIAGQAATAIQPPRFA